MAWFGGIGIGHVGKVAVHRAWLALKWVTIFRLCGWGVDTIRQAGNAYGWQVKCCDPLLEPAIAEHFRDDYQHIIKH